MNEKVTSKLWKDERHIKGSEYRQEVKDVGAFNSYHRNPKQSFKGRKENGKCKVYTKDERQAFEKLLNFDPENKVAN